LSAIYLIAKSQGVIGLEADIVHKSRLNVIECLPPDCQPALNNRSKKVACSGVGAGL
jgi:hypothetical protein